MQHYMPQEKLICQNKSCRKSLVVYDKSQFRFHCKACFHIHDDFYCVSTGLEGWQNQEDPHSNRIEYDQSDEEDDIFSTQKQIKTALEFLQEKIKKLQENERSLVEKRFYNNVNKYTDSCQIDNQKKGLTPFILKLISAGSLYQEIVSICIDQNEKIINKICKKYKVETKKLKEFMRSNNMVLPQSQVQPFSTQVQTKSQLITVIEKFGKSNNFTLQEMRLLSKSANFIKDNEYYGGEKYSVIASGAIYLVGIKTKNPNFKSYNLLSKLTGISQQSCKKFIEKHITQNIINQFLAE